MLLYDAGVRVCCLAHKAANRMLGRGKEPAVKFHYRYTPDAKNAGTQLSDDSDLAVSPYYGENIGLPQEGGSDACPVSSSIFDDPEKAWRCLIDNSVVPEGWRNSGFRTVCYSKRVSQWCLSSWIWTSAAIARCYLKEGETALAEEIGRAFLGCQEECGGWVVRCDYLQGQPSPILAPNDSCYIAANCLVPLYKKTQDKSYLDAAIRCADWCIDTVLPNGLVPFGYDCSKKTWVTETNIVDIGFTACLFAQLYEITHEERFKRFLSSFTSAYIALFRDPATGMFATCLKKGDVRSGGHFARGQAWALEGLIDALSVLDAPAVEQSIEGIVSSLLRFQRRDGSWCYNLAKPLLGVDGKGVPVIANSLLRWGIMSGNCEAVAAARKAVAWCAAHTDLQGECPGGIFSYCLEGAVTHYFYSEAAFVYSSAYALETSRMLLEIEESND